MIPLQTHIPNPPTDLKIRHSKPILLVGSCFTENIGNRLQSCGFEVIMNPFGILYNPTSIATCLSYCLNDKKITQEELFEHNGLVHSWLHHSCYSRASKEECLLACNQSIETTYQRIKEGAIIIVTLGSSWVYEWGNFGVVANCHKVPNNQFKKRLLSIDEIARQWTTIASQLQQHEMQLITTISPIRHWADTPHGNQLSKSTLMLAMEQISTAHYFPSYEIMMDELRDYRFYEQDMLHPNTLAIDIIWERFCQTYFDKDTQQLADKYHQLNLMEQHHPRFIENEEYTKFQQKKTALANEIALLRSKIDY